MANVEYCILLFTTLNKSGLRPVQALLKVVHACILGPRIKTLDNAAPARALSLKDVKCKHGERFERCFRAIINLQVAPQPAF